MSKTTYTIKADQTGARYFEFEDEAGNIVPQPPGFRLSFSPGLATTDEHGNPLREKQHLPLGTKITLELPSKAEATALEREAIRYTLTTKARQILINEGKRPTDEAAEALVDEIIEQMASAEAQRPAIVREGVETGTDAMAYFRKAAQQLAKTKPAK